MNKLFFYYRWTLLVCDYKNCAIIAQFPIDIISRLRQLQSKAAIFYLSSRTGKSSGTIMSLPSS